MATCCKRGGSTITGRALLLLVALLVGTAQAQLLAEVMTVTAIQAQFNSSIRFPQNTFRATGPGVNALLSRVEGAQQWADWEAYTLGGTVSALAGAIDHQVSTAFAVAGYFEQSRTERTVQGPAGQEKHTKIVYVDLDGGERLLYFIRAGSEVVWLTARSR